VKKRVGFGTVFSYGILIIVFVFMIFPFFWSILTSFKTESQLFTIPPRVLPDPWVIDNYREVFTSPDVSLPLYMINSLIVSSVSTLCALVLSIPAAYGLAKYASRASGAFLIVIMLIRMIPGIAFSIPYFLMIRQMGLFDTRAALILTAIPGQLLMAIWLMEGSFREIPQELEEAAELDGVGVIRKIVSIVVPISLPIIVTVVLFNFIGVWNEFMLASTLVRTASKRTLSVGMYVYQNQWRTFWGQVMAYGVIFSVPGIIITYFCQKGLVSGLTSGAVKA